MTDPVLVACITAGATIICQLIISSRSNNLIDYRVGLLEEKLDKLNDKIADMQKEEKKKRKSSYHSESIIPYLPNFSSYNYNVPM